MKNIPKLYSHQLDALMFIHGKNKFALFMEQGTGKSKIIIEKSYQLFKNKQIDCIILISPDSVKEQWIEEEYNLHYPENNWKGFIWNGCKTKKSKKEFFEDLEYKEFLVFSCNVEAFQGDTISFFIKLLLEKRKCMIVIDESVKIKNGRRKPIRGKGGGAKRTNQILDLFYGIEYKAILTGTPITKSPFDLWSQFEFLQKDFFNMDYFFFTHHYGILINKKTYEGKQYSTILDEKDFNLIKYKINQITNINVHKLENIAYSNGLKLKDIILISKMDKYSGFKNLNELKDKIKEITFFIKKEDCLDLPNKIYETLKIDMSKEQQRIYKELKEKMMTEYLGEELSLTTKLTLVLRLQMITGGIFPYKITDIKLNKEGEEYFETYYDSKIIQGSSKIKALLEDLEMAPQETSIIIWARFRKEIELIEQNLLENNYTCEKFYGGSDKNISTKFKNKEFQILIASQLKGGMGLNFQIATLHYFYSNSFKADLRLQAEDRSHRSGQTNKVTYKDLICRHTVDERVYKILKERGNLIDYFRTKDIGEILND